MDKNYQIQTLGSNGRFGNQIFQFMFGWGLSRAHGIPLKIPVDWVGRKIFRIDDIPAIDPGDSVDARTPIDFVPNKNTLEFYNAVDLHGYWQFQEALDFYSGRMVRERLKFQDWVLKKFPKPQKFTVAIHKRRGDYPLQPNHYCSIMDASFDTCLHEQVLPSCPPDTKIVELTEENPQRDAECEAVGLGFLPDFMTMVNADVLIRSNSTFSLVAPWFNFFTRVFAPLVEDKVGWNAIEFVEGNWPRCCDQKYHPSSVLTDLDLKD